MILDRIFKTRVKPERRLYGAIVAAARHPRFYTEMAVPDSIEGRFEMIVIHLFLVLNRLKSQGLEELRQNLTDEFFEDMDGSLRELGVSDVAVGKKVRRLLESYYGRILAYNKALHDQEMLEDAVRRNVHGEETDRDCKRRLARYIMDASRSLENQSLDELLRAELKLP